MDSPLLSGRTGLVRVALAALLLAGCPARQSAPSAPAAPTNVTLNGGASFDELVLLWTPPAPPVTGYEPELRIEDGPWEGSSQRIPGNAIGVDIALNKQVPERVTLYAHVRAWNGLAASPFSEPAAWFRGLRPLAAASATVEGEERVRLAWTQGSTASPEIRVERALYEDPTFTWGDFAPVATLSPDATTWLDAASVLPGSAVRYRLRNVSTYQGAPVESPYLVVEPGLRPTVAAPADLQVVLVGGAPVLTWTNRSGVATSLRVERADGLVTGGLAAFATFYAVVTLPADTTLWTDAVPAGAYTYRVVALRDQLPGASAPAQVVVPPAGLSVAVVEAPQGDYAVRAADGALWMAANASAVDGVRLWEPVASSWTGHRFAPPGHLVVPPGPALDTQGRPHLLYLEDVPSGTIPGPADLVYAWHDGTAWQHEVAARRTFDRVFSTFGAGGEPHVAWQEWDRAFPEHAVRTAGGWTVERLTSNLYDPILAYSIVGFGASADGALSMLIGTPTSLVLQTLPAAGGWAEEVVPTGPDDGWLHGERLLLFTGGVTIAYCRSAAVPYRLTTLTRTGGSWGAPVEVATMDTPGASGTGWTGASMGTRRALLVRQGAPEGLWLYRWDEVGGWDATRLRQTTGWETSWLGFTPAGKLWVLAPGASPLAPEEAAAGALQQYLSFTEP